MAINKPDSAPPSAAARTKLIVLAVLVGGMLVVCLLPISVLGLAWVFHEKDKPPVDKQVKQTTDQSPLPQVEDVQQPTKKSKPPAPTDPRIKIVQPAVDKGVVFLKSKVPELKGKRAGYVGMIGLTLLECGVPADDPAILQIAEFIRAGLPTMCTNYDLAASLFFLNRWDEGRRLDEKDRKMARTFALRIIAGQLSTGIWGYGGAIVIMSPEQEAKLVASLEDGTYKPNSRAVGVAPSMSNTQFAMLAIWGARKHGVPIRAPLLALAAYFHAHQNADGSWNYPNHSLKATSTCAGLISLAIEVALREDQEFAPGRRRSESDGKKKADVDKAFAFVAKIIGRKKGDPGGGTEGFGGRLFDADALGDLYFLWTLERVSVIYSKDLIGGKDWFDWGYPIVLKAQQPDGSWNEKHGPLIDTCFALLFLKRANIARDLTEMIRTRGGRPVVDAP